MSREYKYISGDTHLEVPAWRWTNRVPEKYRDRAPRTVRLANGGDALLIEGIPLRENANDMFAGKDDWRPTGNNYDNTPGTGTPDERLACLDKDGMDAEIMFHAVGHGVRTWRNIRDDNVYKACIRAYNEFIAEEYAAHAPDRFFPMGCMPQTNVKDALEELENCAKKGLKGIALSSWPNGGEYPTDEDDAFWAEAVKIKMPVTIHVELVRTGGFRDGSLVKFPDRKYGGQDLADRLVKFARTGGFNVVQFILSGTFDRNPDLRVLFAENQICWVPVFLTVMDERYEKHLEWSKELLGFKELPNGKPSDYVRRHVLWGFQHDPAGVALRDYYGEDNAVWGSDFPHQESDYPHSMKVIESNFKGVPDDVRYKMICGNAKEFFHIA